MSDGERARRRQAWRAPAGHGVRGYVRLYLDHVLQADRSVDMDFLVGSSGAGDLRMG